MYRAREQSIIGVYTGRAAAAVIIDTAGYQHDSLSSLSQRRRQRANYQLLALVAALKKSTRRYNRQGRWGKRFIAETSAAYVL